MFSAFDNFMFTVGPIFIGIIFITVFAMFIFVIGSNIKQYAANKAKAVETVPARVVGKRPHTWGGSGNSSAHTSYYMTFELDNGERIEMPVRADFYGMHIEGDLGMLTHQGTHLINFERERI